MTRSIVAPHVTRRSSIPGRQRWEALSLRGRPDVGARLERLLGREEGIVSARANALTGRVLVIHATVLDEQRLAELIGDALRRAIAATDLVPERQSADAPSPARWVRRALIGIGGGLVAAGLVLSHTMLAVSAAVGVGVAATTSLLVKKKWKRSRQMWATAVRPAKTAAPDAEHPLERILGYAGASRRRIRIAATCSVLTKVIDVTPPLCVGVAVTILISGGVPLLAALGFASVYSQMALVATVGAVLWTIEAGLQYVAERIWREIGQEVQHKLRVDAYAHVQQLPMGYLDEQRIGDIAAILNDDINQIQAFSNSGASDLVQIITNIVIVGPLFYLLCPTVAWIAVLPIPFVVWASFFYEDYTAREYTAVRESSGLVASQIVNNLEGLATIRSFAAEGHEATRIRDLSQQYSDANTRPNLFAAGLTPLVRMSVLVGFGGTMLLGGHQVIVGALGAGIFGAMIALTQRFIYPLTRLGELVDGYQRTISACTRVIGLLEEPLPVDTGTRSLDVARVRGEIVFENVTFAYAGHDPVLRDLSLTVPERANVAVVGTTGGGKSTLVRLLLRLYEIRSGRILLDGIDVRDIRLPDLRRAIGVVSQDAFLFHGSVRDNIAYGTFDADDAAIVRAARLAEAHEFIVRLPQGYDTFVGDRGIKLSGGQRQRISLARAILKNPPVLILDEATASVDNETEAAIQRALRTIATGRTTIAIAHRLSTVRHADLTHVMDRDGRIVEQGKHEELLQKGGLYASLWRVQSGASLQDEKEEVASCGARSWRQ